MTHHSSQEISASRFKATCLELMKNVHDQRFEVIITKRGRPIAKLVPYDDDAPPAIYGFMAGTGVVAGDIVSAMDETWSAESE